MTAGRARLGRPPGSTREDTVARLLTAAQAHFGDRGYAGARIVEIAKAAGLTHSSVYQYFPSKADLYRAALTAALDELAPRYLAGIAGADRLRDQLAALFRASATVHAGHPAITPFLASVPLEIRRHPELVDRSAPDNQALMAAFTGMFDAARARGEVPADIADLDLTIAFLGAAMGIGLLSHGLGRAGMDAAVEVMLSAFAGEFFRPIGGD